MFIALHRHHRNDERAISIHGLAERAAAHGVRATAHKTTHYKLDAVWDGCTENEEMRYAFENGHSYASPEGEEVPKDSTMVLRRRVIGVALLRTSRELASEATVILQPKLDAVRTSP